MKTRSRQPSLNARCRLGELTFARMGGKEEDVPISDPLLTRNQASTLRETPNNGGVGDGLPTEA